MNQASFHMRICFFGIFARNLVFFLVQSDGSFPLHSPWDMWIIWRIHEACPVDASSIRIHKVILRKSLSGWFRDVTFWFLMLLKETDGRVWGLFDSSFSMLDSFRPNHGHFQKGPKKLKFYDVARPSIDSGLFIEWFSETDKWCHICHTYKNLLGPRVRLPVLQPKMTDPPVTSEVFEGLEVGGVDIHHCQVIWQKKAFKWETMILRHLPFFLGDFCGRFYLCH